MTQTRSPSRRIICRSAFEGRPDRVVPWPDDAPSAFAALRAGGQPIASSCSGETVCGRCTVQVLAGGGQLPPAAPQEESVLAVMDAEPGERLACRLSPSYVSGEIVLRTNYW